METCNFDTFTLYKYKCNKLKGTFVRWILKIKSGLHKSDLLLVLLWFIAFLVVSPFGDFPINDDWSYSKNVYHLVVEHRFVVDSWPAMNLISQTLYGSFFASVFGFSFLTLRLSIFALVVVASFVFKRTVEKITCDNKWLALFLVVVFLFNPLMLALSFTFMTDMFFASIIIFALYFLVSYLEHPKISFYIFFVFFCVIAILSRQHGLFISFLSISILSVKIDRWKKFMFIAIPPVMVWLAHDQYRHFLTANQIPNGIKYSNDFLTYLIKAPISNHLFQTADSIIVVGLMLLPMILLLLFSGYVPLKKHLMYGLPLLFLIAYLIYYVWEYYPLGNVTYVLQCGPRVVKTDFAEQQTNWVLLVSKIQIVFGGISFYLALLYILYKKDQFEFNTKFLSIGLKLIGLCFFIFVAISEAYFDRYLIPLIFLFLVLLVPKKQLYFTQRISLIATLIGTFLFVISVVEVHDYFEWQNTRWKALKDLNQKGISARQIDGGFEYNGWYKPTEGWSEEGKSWWWVNDDQYVVCSQRLKNYSVENTYAVKQFLPLKPDTIFVLRRK